MRQMRSVRLALCLLDRTEPAMRRGNLSGDLLEELESGRTTRWFWYQLFSAILINIIARMNRYATMLAFSMGWAALYPLWRYICVGGLTYSSNHYGIVTWPWSSLMPIAYGVLPAVLFVWLGFAACMALSGSINSYSAYKQCFALSMATTMIFSASFLVLHQIGHPQLVIEDVTRTDFFFIDHIYFVSVPIALSLWAVLWIGAINTPYVGRRKRKKSAPLWRGIARIAQIFLFVFTLSTFSSAQSPVPTEQTHGTDEELIKTLQMKLAKEAASGKFSGAVLITKDGLPLFEQAYGLADRERSIPSTVETRFRIGSINKVFTAVAIMQLAEAGKIKLDDPLVNYIPDYPNRELAKKVTIRELLNHTGGTGDVFGTASNQLFSDEFRSHRLQLKTLDDYIHLYGSRPLRFVPGSRFEYSNYGYILLGRVIEKASHQNYYDYMQKHVYSPAGMKSTGELPIEKTVAKLSIGYTTMDGSKTAHDNTDTLPYRGIPAGMGYSTVRDLLAFAVALQQNKLLDSHYTSLMETGNVDMVRDGSYGYGLMVHPLNGSTCIGHAGGYPGMNADVELCSGSKYVFVVLANVDPPVAQRLGFFIANWVTQSRP